MSIQKLILLRLISYNDIENQKKLMAIHFLITKECHWESNFKTLARLNTLLHNDKHYFI